MMGKRAQSALEYLMTYGWALVVIIIVIGALFAMGILNPSTYQKQNCNGFDKLAYVDHVADATANTFTIAFRNGKGADINVNTVKIIDYSDSTKVDTGTYNTVLPAEDLNSYQVSLSSVSLTSGKPYKVWVEVTYVDKETGLTHTEKALCVGRAK